MGLFRSLILGEDERIMGGGLQSFTVDIQRMEAAYG